MGVCEKVTVFDVDPDAVIAFWDRVVKRAGEDCWQWHGGLHERGYGRLQIKGKAILAHRFSWQTKHGSIPNGKVLRHRATPICNNRGCVRPDHLELVSRYDACARGGRRAAARQTEYNARRNRNELLDVEPLVFNVKHDAVAAVDQHSQSREERMIEELVAQGQRREATWAQALELARSQAAESDKRMAQVVKELAQLREAHRTLIVAPEPVGAPPEPPMETPVMPAENTLGAVLVTLYARAACLPLEAIHGDQEARLLSAFDRALAEAGGNGRGGLQVFSAWLKQWKAEVPLSARNMSSFERLTSPAVPQ